MKETIVWIDVSDRLPDTDREVLICMTGAEAARYATGIGYLDGDGWSLSDSTTIFLTRITHWAELPKGPAAAEVTP
jgi:hypothetical protein